MAASLGLGRIIARPPVGIAWAARSARRKAPWCSWPNTPPCQGGDRRFESARGRHLHQRARPKLRLKPNPRVSSPGGRQGQRVFLFSDQGASAGHAPRDRSGWRTLRCPGRDRRHDLAFDPCPAQPLPRRGNRRRRGDPFTCSPGPVQPATWVPLARGAQLRLRRAPRRDSAHPPGTDAYPLCPQVASRRRGRQAGHLPARKPSRRGTAPRGRRPLFATTIADGQREPKRRRITILPPGSRRPPWVIHRWDKVRSPGSSWPS